MEGWFNRDILEIILEFYNLDSEKCLKQLISKRAKDKNLFFMASQHVYVKKNSVCSDAIVLYNIIVATSLLSSSGDLHPAPSWSPSEHSAPAQFI